MTFLAALALPAWAGEALWDGYDWDESYGDIAVVDGDMVVTASTCFSGAGCFGAAHINTPGAFRDADGQAITVDLETGGYAAAQVWIEQEGGGNPTFIQYGFFDRDRDVDATADAYGIAVPKGSPHRLFAYVWNVDTGETALEFFDVKRTGGEHELAVRQLEDADGVATGIEFLYDGQIVGSSDIAAPDYFGDLYLATNVPDSDKADESITFQDVELTTSEG